MFYNSYHSILYTVLFKMCLGSILLSTDLYHFVIFDVTIYSVIVIAFQAVSCFITT